MNLVLADLEKYMQGAIPSLIATSSAAGMPDVSYLSHVFVVDTCHVVLSNQFFSETTKNLRSRPLATLLVVDGDNIKQYILDITYVGPLSDGSLFDYMAAQARADCTRVGLSNMMRVRNVDLFRVTNISVVPAQTPSLEKVGPRLPSSLKAVSRVLKNIVTKRDTEGLVDATLEALRSELQMTHVILLALDADHIHLSAIGSRGYKATGIGSTVVLGEGTIGVAAATGHPIRVTDLSRSARLSAAVALPQLDTNMRRRVAVPGLPNALSQIAVPIIVSGRVKGVFFAESAARMAFSVEDEAALSIISEQFGLLWGISSKMNSADRATTTADIKEGPLGALTEAVYYDHDHSVFINGEYVIKGVAGKLLYYMLRQRELTGKSQFCNRELRRESSFNLPRLKDNLETRLLLLRRRLEEKNLSIYLQHSGRGEVTLQVKDEFSLKMASGRRKL